MSKLFVSSFFNTLRAEVRYIHTLKSA